MWGPHHPLHEVLVSPGKIQVLLEARATDAVPVAADIFHENSWVSGSVLSRAVHPLQVVHADPGWAAHSCARADFCSFLLQISAAVGRGADPAPGLKKSPLGGWQVEKQNTGRVLQGGEKK